MSENEKVLALIDKLKVLALIDKLKVLALIDKLADCLRVLGSEPNRHPEIRRQDLRAGLDEFDALRHGLVSEKPDPKAASLTQELEAVSAERDRWKDACSGLQDKVNSLELERATLKNAVANWEGYGQKCKRRSSCCYCGKELGFGTAAELNPIAQAHHAVCEQNPLAQKLKQAKEVLG
jgi:hypothetical protein